MKRLSGVAVVGLAATAGLLVPASVASAQGECYTYSNQRSGYFADSLEVLPGSEGFVEATNGYGENILAGYNGNTAFAFGNALGWTWGQVLSTYGRYYFEVYQSGGSWHARQPNGGILGSDVVTGPPWTYQVCNGL